MKGSTELILLVLGAISAVYANPMNPEHPFEYSIPDDFTIPGSSSDSQKKHPFHYLHHEEPILEHGHDLGIYNLPPIEKTFDAHSSSVASQHHLPLGSNPTMDELNTGFALGIDFHQTPRLPHHHDSGSHLLNPMHQVYQQGQIPFHETDSLSYPLYGADDGTLESLIRPRQTRLKPHSSYESSPGTLESLVNPRPSPQEPSTQLSNFNVGPYANEPGRPARYNTFLWQQQIPQHKLEHLYSQLWHLWSPSSPSANQISFQIVNEMLDKHPDKVAYLFTNDNKKPLKALALVGRPRMFNEGKRIPQHPQSLQSFLNWISEARYANSEGEKKPDNYQRKSASYWPEGLQDNKDQKRFIENMANALGQNPNTIKKRLRVRGKEVIAKYVDAMLSSNPEVVFDAAHRLQDDRGQPDRSSVHDEDHLQHQNHQRNQMVADQSEHFGHSENQHGFDHQSASSSYGAFEPNYDVNLLHPNTWENLEYTYDPSLTHFYGKDAMHHGDLPPF